MKKEKKPKYEHEVFIQGQRIMLAGEVEVTCLERLKKTKDREQYYKVLRANDSVGAIPESAIVKRISKRLPGQAPWLDEDQ